MFELVRAWRFLRALIAIITLPEGRALTILLGIQVAVGSVFYATVEGWAWIDSLYFCIVAITTVGFGDPHPSTTLSRVFTMGYLLVGVGLLLSFVALVGTHIGAWEKPDAPGRPRID